MIFYFSGTGNSKWVASQLSEAQGERLISIADEMNAPGNSFEYTLAVDEKIGFVFPVYSWAPPRIVLDFISKTTLINYHNQYLFFVCSCGDDTGLTRNVFLKAIDKKQWACQAGYSVIMPNNYVLLKGFDTDPKKLEEKKLREAVPAVKHINSRLSGKKKEFHCEEGCFPNFKTRIINPLFNKYQITAKPFYATAACLGCGDCERVCPVRNVTVDGKPHWGDNCTICLACYHVCPRHAIHYGNKTKKKGHYFNPDI